MRKKKYRFNFEKAHWSVQALLSFLGGYLMLKVLQLMFLAAYVLAPASQWQM